MKFFETFGFYARFIAVVDMAKYVREVREHILKVKSIRFDCDLCDILHCLRNFIERFPVARQCNANYAFLIFAHAEIHLQFAAPNAA